MNYIVIMVVSVVVLILTTHKVKPVKEVKGADKAPFFDRQALVDVIQQIVIVFLSALLAMGLTEYMEEKTAAERAEDYVNAMETACFAEYSELQREILDLYDTLEDPKANRDEQIKYLADFILDRENNLFETMLFHDELVSSLSPQSYLTLVDDMENAKLAQNRLAKLDLNTADRQVLADYIAQYLFYCMDTYFNLGAIDSNGIDFELSKLGMLTDEQLQNGVHADYNERIVMLEELFDVDLGKWYGYRRNGFPINSVLG